MLAVQTRAMLGTGALSLSSQSASSILSLFGENTSTSGSFINGAIDMTSSAINSQEISPPQNNEK